MVQPFGWHDPRVRLALADIYRLPLAGGEIQQLTTDPADDFAPAWSPDGAALAFHSFRSGTRDIFVMQASGGEAQQVTSGSAQDRFPMWSPDGNRIAFQRSTPHQIYLIERHGRTGAWGTPRSIGKAAGSFAADWSVDGRSIFCVVDGTIREVFPSCHVSSG
ncbi:MAG: TolB family protein [Gemmatimonadales bacterium]